MYPVLFSTVPGLKLTVNTASVSPTTFGDESIDTYVDEIVPTAKFYNELVPVTVLVEVEHPV